MQYDALGQLRSRITDSVYYPTKNCSFWGSEFGGGTCLYNFPLSTQGNPLTVPSDTAEFDYDAAGRMIAADNASARIRRTYSPGGLLLTDTSRVRTLGNVWQGDLIDLLNFNSHVYGLQYSYDRDGRLTNMAHPGSLVSCPGTVGRAVHVLCVDGPRCGRVGEPDRRVRRHLQLPLQRHGTAR